MSVAKASLITCTELPSLCNTVSRCRSSAATSTPSLLRPTYKSGRRFRSLATHAVNSSGTGRPTIKNESHTESEANGGFRSPPLPKTPAWLKWTLGSIGWLALPSWKKLQRVQDAVSKVDTMVEVIEEAAETAEKLASEVADNLPEGAAMKKAVLGLERASESFLKSVKSIDAFVDKVEEQVEDWKDKEKAKEDERENEEKAAEKKTQST